MTAWIAHTFTTVAHFAADNVLPIGVALCLFAVGAWAAGSEK